MQYDTALIRVDLLSKVTFYYQPKFPDIFINFSFIFEGLFTRKDSGGAMPPMTSSDMFVLTCE